MKLTSCLKLAALLGWQCWAFEGFSQQTLNSGGTSKTDAGGSIDYSIGEVLYATATGTGGTATPGVVQRVNSTLVGLKTVYQSEFFALYPNPVHDQLTIQNLTGQARTVVLRDMHGRVLLMETIGMNQVQLNMNQFAPSIYLLTVLENNQAIATYKVIKN